MLVISKGRNLIFKRGLKIMSDEDGFWVFTAAVVIVSLWYSKHYQEIMDFKNSVISTGVMVFNCVLFVICGIALVGIGYYCTQRIHEKY